MSKQLRDLDSRFRPIVEQMLDYLISERGIAITVIDTLRTHEEQQANLKAGVSWTKHSKHLPQGPEQKSWAIDIAPTVLLSRKGWAPADPLWWEIAQAAKSFGLRSGMDWSDRGLPPVGTTRSSWDPGHCEWKGPSK